MSLLPFDFPVSVKKFFFISHSTKKKFKEPPKKKKFLYFPPRFFLSTSLPSSSPLKNTLIKDKNSQKKFNKEKINFPNEFK